VVPPLQFNLEKMAERYFGTKPMFVGPGVKTGMPILYDNPREVGADRIVNSVAAFEKHHSGLIVVDFGTATTFDAVSPKGEYLGGSICPGVTIAMEALFENASKLPRVEFARPPHVVGKNTVHSMQSGLVYGYVGLVDGICERMA
jgi:type III pantothenate kinase